MAIFNILKISKINFKKLKIYPWIAFWQFLTVPQARYGPEPVSESFFSSYF